MTTIYNSTKRRLLGGQMDPDADVVRVALVSDSTTYSPAIDTEEYVADVLDGGTTAQEFSGTGYSRQTVGNPATTQDNTDDEAVFDADDVTFSSIDGDTIQGGLLYKQVGGDDTTPGDDPLVAWLTSSEFPMPANGGDVTIAWDAEGILTLG